MKEELLYVDDEQDNLLTLEIALSKWFDVHTAENGEQAIQLFNKNKYKVVVSDQRMPGMSGLELAEKLLEIDTNLVIIILTAFDDTNTLLSAINQGGIYRYILKPWNLNDLRQTLQTAFEKQKLIARNAELYQSIVEKNKELEKALDEIKKLKQEVEEENIQLRSEFKLGEESDSIIGQSDSFKTTYRFVKMAAKSDSTVLLLGESGTGKELFANAIHEHSERRDEAIIKVNCAAIPETLIESELFGHEKGAFTGAQKSKFGKFELANGGTIFLDEIGELPLHVQSKLLRVLQESAFERVGGTNTREVDIRVIAATNRDLEGEVKKGKFREDLFYRLNVVPIEIPPLRDRKDDIQLLVPHFIEKLNRKYGREIKEISASELKKLVSYHWPGNIRELENIIERAYVLSSGSRLDLSTWAFKSSPNITQDNEEIVSLEQNEKEYLIKVLKHTKWKVRGDGGAAQLLDVNPSTLDSRIKKLKIERPI